MGMTSELTVKVRVEAPDRVQVRHSELESREAKTVGVAFGRRESRKAIYGIMKPRDSWDGDKPIQAYVTSLATKTHPIHYAEIGTLSSIEVHTPKKCAATTEDPTPMLSDPPEFLEEPLWVGNITPLEAGSCTFTVHVGGAETTHTLELTY